MWPAPRTPRLEIVADPASALAPHRPAQGASPAGAVTGTSSPDLSDSAAIYSRGQARFDRVDYCKPDDRRAGEIIHAMAPLILQEIKGGSRDRFGALVASNEVTVVDVAQPTVYFQMDTIDWRGKQHPRISYAWCYPPPGKETRAHRVQGVRVTLSPSGQPLFWEILADNSGRRIWFVSARLEAAAVKSYVRPESGRRFVIEPSLAEAPQAIVARVLDDGPMPMGPVVYLDAGTRNTATVICRCMPSQATNIAETVVYRLADFSEAKALAGPLREKGDVSWWPGETEATSPMKQLRQ